MSSISRRSILEIAKTLVGSIINKIPIQQQLVQKLAEILKVERCVVFKISDDCQDKGFEIEIVAGIPIEEHGIGLKESVEKHPDVALAIKNGKVMIVDNPRDSRLTAYFRETVVRKGVNQILYIPLVSSTIKSGSLGVVVIDATGSKTGFNEEEVEFCTEVGELISLIIDREEILVQQMRDLIINRIAALGGFATRLGKLTQEFGKDVQIILDELRKVEEICPKGRQINF